MEPIGAPISLAIGSARPPADLLGHGVRENWVSCADALPACRAEGRLGESLGCGRTDAVEEREALIGVVVMVGHQPGLPVRVL